MVKTVFKNFFNVKNYDIFRRNKRQMKRYECRKFVLQTDSFKKNSLSERKF
jgi:hypothetical protein